jgi:uncharacterized delta-60 repeat protein
MKKILLLSALFIFQGSLFYTLAQPGANDPDFNPGDPGFGFGDGANNIVYTTAIQGDGKIIIGGSFTNYNGIPVNRIARLNTDGSFDSGFNVGGTGADANVNTMAIQSDGKIIIGGDFGEYNGAVTNNIVRLNSDGSLDANFNTGTGANSYVNTVSLQIDGKIIVGGLFTSYNGTPINYIARLNSDGSLDTSFKVGTGANNLVYTTAIQIDGKIIIGGYFSSYNDTTRNYIARLNTDGSLDTSFHVGTGADYRVYTTAIQSDGKIIIGGGFRNYNGSARNYIARLNADGSLDGALDVGTGTDQAVYITVIQSDEEIIIGGAFTSYNGKEANGLTRLNSDGSLDLSFNAIIGKNSLVYTTSLQSNGEIITGGYFGYFTATGRNYIARLDSDGNIDTGFNAGTGANSWVYSTALQSDGKIMIGGYFTTYNNTARNYVARLEDDGGIDSSFNPGAGANSWINTLSVQNDGKIMIGGNFSSYDSIDRNYITRLNSDGSLDVTFNPGTGADNPIQAMVIQSDGKIIIVGNFTSYDGTGRNRIARLNSDGSLDAAFDPGAGANSIVRTITLQSDGKIIIGGQFSAYNGTARNFIARLNTDGSLDATFDPGTAANSYVYTTVIQSDGKIMIGGLFTIYNGTGRNHIARLNSDGSLDSGFNPGTGASDWINSMIIQSDGKIIIGGDFITYNGTSRVRLARLNTDGSLDIGFDTGSGTDFPVWTMAMQNDKKIIIGGGFTNYNGTGRNRIARVLNCTAPDITLNLAGGIISANQNGASYQWVDCNNSNQIIASETNQSYTPAANGNYAVIISLNGCTDTSSCINFLITGINSSVTGNEKITLYPNPSNGAFSISSMTDGNYDIVNELGQIVQSFKLNSANNYTVRITAMNKGMYFIIGINNNEFIRQKAVVLE